jgi:nucleoside-diphosphate-sugar epimerase
MIFLLTGSSGFLGKIVREKLTPNYKVLTLGRDKFHEFKVDDLINISYLPLLKQDIDAVVHIAGLAHIKLKKNQGNLKYDYVNYKGTKSLCEWIENSNSKPKFFIYISSASVYGLDYGNQITEDSPSNGKTPYAISKLKAEQYLLEWGKKLNINVLILRLPLVVGSNPPGNLGKMINGIKRGTYFSIAGGRARKSMVLADDVAELIAACPDVNGIYNLTDGYHPSFAELESMICEQLKKPKPFNMPLGLAKILGKIGDLIPLFPVNTDTINKITQDLTFSDLKARHELGWNPSRVIDKWKI